MADTHDHDHHDYSNQNEKRLKWAFILIASFLLVEIFAAFYTKSLSLLSDAVHMFTDTAALGIALTAAILSKKPADDQRTYGYYRFEILAAAFNALLLFLVSIYILYEAILRINHPTQIDVTGVFWIAVLGLGVNIGAILILSGGQEHSMNVRGAYLEALADLISSVGVIIGAVVMYYTHWMWVDTVVALGIGLWVLPRTYVLLKESMHILLEGVPKGLDINEIREALKKIPGVSDVHDLHVWSLTNQRVTLTAHLVSAERDNEEVLEEAKKMLADQFKIYHATIQTERNRCDLSRPESEHFAPHKTPLIEVVKD